jgi:hypothetical protein
MRPSALTMESLKMVDYLMELYAEKEHKTKKRVSIYSFSFYLCDPIKYISTKKNPSPIGKGFSFIE